MAKPPIIKPGMSPPGQTPQIFHASLKNFRNHHLWRAADGPSTQHQFLNVGRPRWHVTNATSFVTGLGSLLGQSVRRGEFRCAFAFRPSRNGPSSGLSVKCAQANWSLIAPSDRNNFHAINYGMKYLLNCKFFLLVVWPGVLRSVGGRGGKYFT